MNKKLIQIIVRLCYAASIGLVSFVHFSLNVYRPGVRDVSIWIDDAIPLVEAFAVPYLYWFIYIGMGVLYFAVLDYKYYFKLLFSINSGMIFCFFFFYFMPTTIVRPEIVSNDLFSGMVKFVYSMDNPYNCFPSIHVLNSILVTLFICRHNKNIWVRMWAILSYVLISLSTVYIKQHYVLDAVAASFIGVAVYYIANSSYLWNKKILKRITDFAIPAGIRD